MNTCVFTSTRKHSYCTWSVVWIPLLKFSRFAWPLRTFFARSQWAICHHWFVYFELSVESNTSSSDALSFWNQFTFWTRAISPYTLMFVTTEIRKHTMITAPRTLGRTCTLCNLCWLKFTHIVLTANEETKRMYKTTSVQQQRLWCYF
jgi:hypothetical protein